MKLRLAVLGLFLALCVAPAFADTLGFFNHGLITGSAGASGISLTSELKKVTFDGTTILCCNVGTVGLTPVPSQAACLAVVNSPAALSKSLSTPLARFFLPATLREAGPSYPMTSTSWWEHSLPIPMA